MARGIIPAQQFKVVMPLDTHWEKASCEAVACPAFLNGWQTILPVDSDLIATLRSSGRSYTEERGDDGLIRFTFAAGQPCFRASMHREQTERPALYIHTSEGHEPRRVEPAEWRERFDETLNGLSEIDERG